MAETPSSEFRERALWEAERYGGDAYVFVRELLQNARDAYASRVEIDVGADEGRVTVSIADDGAGMSDDDARKYLFRLYASSKGTGDAGRFGVGFWSVLRFEPARIIVRSRSERGAGWEIELSGDLRHAEHRPFEMPRGTQVILERAGGGADEIEADVRRALERDCRHLMRRSEPRRPMAIVVDGEPVDWDRRLPPPSSRFSRRGISGEVALGSTASAEVFSKGLLVRRASCLQDLLDPATGGDDPGISPMGQLFPRAVIHCDDIEPLLARATLRDTKRLRRAIRIGQAELGRLIEARLDQAGRRGVWERCRDVAGTLGRRLRSLLPRPARGAAALLLLALALALVAPAVARRALRPSASYPTSIGRGMASAPIPIASSRTPYDDIASAYRGPEANEESDLSRAVVDLRYAPVSERPLFAALELGPSELAHASDLPQDLHAYDGLRCQSGCLDVVLAVKGSPGIFRIPLPTGHRLDTTSVTLGGEQVDPKGILATEQEQAALLLSKPTSGVLRYRTGPGRGPAIAAPAAARGSRVHELSQGLERLPAPARIGAALDRVRERVAYDLSPETSRRHREAAARGLDLVDRALSVGAGDCDVLNAVLVTVLAELEVPARLAVGFTGQDGRTEPGLHAWAEIQDDVGAWRAIDASARPVLQFDGAPGADTEPLPMPVTVAGAELPSRPVSAPGTAQQRTVLPWILLTMLVPLLVQAGRGRGRRAVLLGDAAGIAPLIAGSLQHPEAFGAGGPLETRRLIPLRGGGRISLSRARELAARNRLYASRRVAGSRRSAAVLDLDREEARLVAAALPVQDVDRFLDLLAASGSDPRSVVIEDRLRSDGFRVALRVAPGLPAGEIAVLDASILETPPAGATRCACIVLLPPEDRILASLGSERGLLCAIDELTSRAGVAPPLRARLLAAASTRALVEGA
ncbi:MAG: ATP-binding protein [Acidobacteriota bacterium]